MSRPFFDKTILTLGSLVLAGVAIFTILTKLDLPQVNYTFFDANPFAIKRDIVESHRNWIFAFVAILGVGLQAYSEISNLPERLHTSRSYLLVTVLMLVVMIFCALGLTKSSDWLAKRKWMPEIISRQKEFFLSSQFVLSHNGLRADQVKLPPNDPDLSKYKEINYSETKRQIEQIEKLLDIKPQGDLQQRIENLEKYFSR